SSVSFARWARSVSDIGDPFSSQSVPAVHGSDLVCSGWQFVSNRHSTAIKVISLRGFKTRSARTSLAEFLASLTGALINFSRALQKKMQRLRPYFSDSNRPILKRYIVFFHLFAPSIASR